MSHPAKSITIVAPLALVCLASTSLLAGHRKPLFNGEDFSGWTITGCQAVVEDGSLVITEGDGFIRTDHRYRNFVLELEWKPRRDAKWDSGIYFRSELPTNRPWPKRYQINLLQNQEGNGIGLPKARSQGLVKPGWNKMKLTVHGDNASMEINGRPAWKTDGVADVDGYIGIQVEVPGGGQFEFRNIFVTELDHRSIFDGKTLAGWEGAGQDAAACWQVEEGLLMCTGAKGPWLRFTEQVDDFNLRMEYRLKEGGNSGVYVRVPVNGNHHGLGAGVEVQILDDNAERYKKLKDWQYAASVYKIAPAHPRVCRPAGEWNTLEIDCSGDGYVVTHNGVVVVRADLASHPGLGERLKRGFIGLQNHSEEVWFRHVRLGPTAQPPFEAPPAP